MTAPEIADPDRPCEHNDFHATVEVARITKTDGGPVEGFKAEIRVRCANCDEAFRWIGDYPVGDVPDRATVSVDGYELRAPIRPGSSDDDFGLGLGGFIARVSEPDRKEDTDE